MSEFRASITIAVIAFVTQLTHAAHAVDPPACQGRGAVTLDVSVLDIGVDASFAITGRAGARFMLAADKAGNGPRPSRIGPLCLNLGNGLVILHDSLRGNAAPLDETGYFEMSVQVPGNPVLRGRSIHFQAIVRDPAENEGYATSRGESRVIGNGSRGDYTGPAVEIPRFGTSRTADVELGDVDGDGDLDLFTVNILLAQNELFLNNGDGTFVNATESSGIPLGLTRMKDCGFGDVDSDGDLDLVVAGNVIPVQLLINDGTGYFEDRATGHRDTGIEVDYFLDYLDVEFADVDRDGDLDLLLSSQSVRSQLLINTNGLGKFVLEQDRFGGQESIAAAAEFGDVDGDGDLDLTTVASDNQPRLFLNDGLGYFTDETFGVGVGLPAYTRSQMAARDVELGDVDGDGDLDMIWAQNELWSDGGGRIGPGRNKLLLNDGNGLFVEMTDGDTVGLPEIYDYSQAVELGDIDRDGDLDLYVYNITLQGPDYLLLNDGRGRFEVPSSESGTGIGLQQEFGMDMKFGDLDGDGDLDIVIPIDLPGTSRVFFNR